MMQSTRKLLTGREAPASSRNVVVQRVLVGCCLTLTSWFLIATSSCDRATKPKDNARSLDGGRVEELTAASGVYPRGLARDRDCDAQYVQRLISGVTQPQIRYLWQDCNGNSAEDESGDTYIADYLNNGTIDRKALYREGETSIEYYQDDAENPLIFLWYVSGDRWHLTDFAYSQAYDQWESEHHTGYFTLQKLCHQNNQWYPYSESPFCFYDIDNDGVSEVALRFSTLYDPEQDANDYSEIWGKLEERPRPLLCGFRLSFDLENDATLASPYSYTMSFTVELLDPIDEAPYLRPHMTQYGRKLNFIPKETALRLAHDILTNSVHVRKRIGLAYERVCSERWEGVIWYQDGVHNIGNAGKPGTRSDRLQDFVDCSSEDVRIYFSEYDQLVHLRAADNSIFRTRAGNLLYTDPDGDGYAERVDELGKTVYIDPDKFKDLSIKDLFGKYGITLHGKKTAHASESRTQ